MAKTTPRRCRPAAQLMLRLSLLLEIVACSVASSSRGRFYEHFDVVWGETNANLVEEGRVLELTLDESVGSRIQSKHRYMYGRFDMEIKLVRGESAGTITSFYICTGGLDHDEVDFEFLGNVSGEPYVLHTNIFSAGKGDKEQQFYLWFDPTEDFHTYSILWNPSNIIFYIDRTPIRVFKNYGMFGVPFPSKKPVRVFASIWNAEEWATQGGRVKTNWSWAPFVASYRSYNLSNACVWNGDRSRCASSSWFNQKLDWWSWMSLSWVRMNYLIYDYCSDVQRFRDGSPPECAIPLGKDLFL